ncbi:MAG: DUF933 domain-containing protein [Candidatus Omnitrophica bacterium]|nr:DUF933 domain-containing protein [Candidatus Omnitrophota bacterium]
MKIYSRIEEFFGKKQFRDEKLVKLQERFQALKTVFYGVEFTNERRDSCDCILAGKDELLDFIVEDIERGENLISKVEEKAAIEKGLEILNREKLLFEELSGEDLKVFRDYSFVTAKPIIVWSQEGLDQILLKIFEKTKTVFFYAAGKKEVHAWMVPLGSDVVTAASKIHSDLARGFIRAEVYNASDLDNFKNLSEAKQRGLLKLVDKSYIVNDGDVLDVKFSV